MILETAGAREASTINGMEDGMDAATKWNERYGSEEFAFGAKPNQFVVELTRGLAPGRVLDLGAGEGRNAVWLAGRGHDVIAVDLSPVGLSKAVRLAELSGVSLEAEVADLAEYAPAAGAYDLVLLSYVQVAPELRRAIHAGAVAALAPGGHLVLVAHHADNLEHGYGGSASPEVLYDEKLLREDFAGLDILRCEAAIRVVAPGTPEEAEAIDVVLLAVRPES